MATPFVIGIGGGSASGKSTLARRLQEALASDSPGLSVRVMPMDTYFRAEKPLHRGPLSGREWPDFNQPDAFHLDRLLADLEAATGDVVIAEGLMMLVVEGVRARCDLKLFVDAPADERIVRRLRRNMAERGLSFDEIASYYLESVCFRHAEYVEPSRWQADLVVNGVLLTDTAVRAVADHVLAAVGRRADA
jgi:uridine kinase